jgi:MYXO-CTERM domain-containing protein
MARRVEKKYGIPHWSMASPLAAWLLILCSLASATPAKADIIIGDLSAGDNGTNSFSSTIYWASSFTMGSNDYTLTDIQIVMAGVVPSGTSFEVESDGGTIPSNDVLLTLVNPVFGAPALVTYTFVPPSVFTLEANTTYWLVASSTNSLSSHWENGVGDQTPTGVGATYGTRTESPASGTVWGGAANNTNLFEVDGTLQASTPEPGSFGLAAIGLGLFLLRRGRRRPVSQRLLVRAAS